MLAAVIIILHLISSHLILIASYDSSSKITQCVIPNFAQASIEIAEHKFAEECIAIGFLVKSLFLKFDNRYLINESIKFSNSI